jgi:hypothetical protein
MAYITAEQVKGFRNEIKSIFPKTFKFSVTREHHSTVNIHLMESPLNIEAHSNREFKTHKTIKKILKAIINNGNHDKSDLMTDYHDVGWYTHIQAGKWDKQYKQISF